MKGLDFENERYVRIYTRDTPDWLLLPWQARALFALVSRKLDRAGVLDIGQHDPAKAVAAVVQVPLDVTEPALSALLDSGLLELRGQYLLDPVFLESQEAKQSDKARARAARERRRDGAVTKRDGSEQGDATEAKQEPDAPTDKSEGDPSDVTNCDAPVTNSDDPSRKRTDPSLRAVPSVPCSAVPNKHGASREDSVSVVFEYWDEKLWFKVHGHKSRKGTDEHKARLAKIRTRLKSFSVEQLQTVIDKVAADSWQIERAYIEPKTIFSNDAKVSGWLARKPTRNGKPVQAATLDAAERALAKAVSA